MHAQVLSPAVHIGLKRILVATDFSAASQRAALFARNLARRFDSEVILVHVLPAESGPPWSSRADLTAMYDAADDAIADAAETFSGMPCTKVLERGTIEHVLMDLGHKQRADLFVLGTHGRGVLEKLVLGSAAEHVIRTAGVPVITAGPHVDLHPEAPLRIERILFATDLSADAMAATPWAIALAEELDAELTVAHFVHPDIRSPFERYRAAHECEAAMRRTLGATRAEVTVEFEHPGKGIAALARARDAHLIVLGIKRAPFPRAVAHLPTRVIDGALMQAPCPVFTICPGLQPS